MQEKNFKLADILGADPLAKFLLTQLNIKPYVVSFVFVLAGLIYAVLIPSLSGFGWREVDAINWLNIFLVFPTAGYFYVYQPQSILRVYNSAVVFLREEGAGKIFTGSKLHQYHGRVIWAVLPVLIAALSAWLGIVGNLVSFGRFWYNTGWIEISAASLVRFVAMYMLASIAMRHLATSLTLNELFQYVQFPLTLDRVRVGQGFGRLAEQFREGGAIGRGDGFPQRLDGLLGRRKSFVRIGGLHPHHLS